MLGQFAGKMSTSEDIREVYEADNSRLSHIVREKFGILAFYDLGKGMRQFHLVDEDVADERGAMEIRKIKHGG